MRRRSFIVLAGAATAAWPAIACAQRSAMPQVGFLHPGFALPLSVSLKEEWRLELVRQGWVEGRTIAITYHWAEGDPDRLRELAAALVRRKVDLVFAMAHAAAAVFAIDRSILMVALDLEGDPVTLGLATSLARPGGSVTGIYLNVPELTAKHLELLKEIAPRMTSIAVIGDPAINRNQFALIDGAARLLGVRVHPLSVQNPADLDRAFATAIESHAEGLVVLSSPFANQHSPAIAAFALRARLPAISMFRSFPEAGGLIGYGPNLPDMFRRAASYSDRVLRGTPAADLPIQRPAKFDMIVNAKTAKALAIEIPGSIFARADEVIE